MNETEKNVFECVKKETMAVKKREKTRVLPVDFDVEAFLKGEEK